MPRGPKRVSAPAVEARARLERPPQMTDSPAWEGRWRASSELATALSFVVQFQPAVRSVSGIGASDGRARRRTGPATPLPGCVEAGGSLAGNVISNSMDRIRSCSSFDLRCRLASLIVNSRWCGRHRTYALPKALSRLGGLSQEGEMTSKRAVRLADAPEGGSRSQLRAPKSATLSGAPRAASLPVSDGHFATGRCRP